MNGYEFVTKVLAETNNDVGPLIELAGHIETEWLEFKAATGPQNGIFDENEIKGDYRFHVAAAFFALANNIGGAVLIGVDDNVDVVGLEDSGFTGNEDKFKRSLIDKLLKPKKAWKTKKKGSWKCSEPDHGLFSLEMGTFKEKPVVIVFIQPRKTEDGWLELEHNHNQSSIRKIPRRIKGGVGQNEIEAIEDSIALKWWANRDVDRLTDKFEALLKSLFKKTPEVINNSISQYLEILKNEIGYIDNSYTPLDAERLEAKLSKSNTKKRKGFNQDKNWLPNKSNEKKKQRTTDQGHQVKPLLLKGVNPSSGDVLELLEQETRAVLLGEPGAGKSTCLGYRALSISTDWKPGQPWPLLVSLCEYTKSGLRSLLIKRLPELEWLDIEDEIASGEIILLLDALNECPQVYYEDCSQEISGLFSDYPSANITLTSRLTTNPHQLGLPTFEILPMDNEKQLHFLAGYLDNSKQDAIDLLERLYIQPSAGLIARSPILLRMVAWVVSEDGDLPIGIAKLYQQFFEGWYRRESQKDEENGTAIIRSLNFVRDALSLLAFRMRANGLVSCQSDFVRETFSSMMDDFEILKFIDRFSQGLLLERNDDYGTYHFSHETVQEYLAAEFLAAHHEDALLQNDAGRKIGNWAMPLVFAFELVDTPAEGLLHSAWNAEPLLVSAALRSRERLDLLAIPQENLWLVGVLKALRGKEITKETQTISYEARLPPKYPLPENLVNTLRSMPFWYAAQTHEEGVLRLERLQRLVLDRGDIWIELLPIVCSAQPAWSDVLTSAQRLLIGKTDGVDIITALNKVTVTELCALHRNKMIPNNYFRSTWKKALYRSDDTQIKMDIISLLRTNEVKVSQFNAQQTTHLKQIGDNWDLSPRLLNKLVRGKIVSRKDLRKNTSRIDNLFSRMSPMNIVRFENSGVIKQDDVTPGRLNELIEKIETSQDAHRLIESGLIALKDIPIELYSKINQPNVPSSRRISSNSDFITDESRNKVKNEIVAKMKMQDELIALATMSPEKKSLKQILQNLSDPVKQKPSNGYHAILAEHLSNSMGWPDEERFELIDKAEIFYKKYASKKKYKGYRDLIKKLREKT